MLQSYALVAQEHSVFLHDPLLNEPGHEEKSCSRCQALRANIKLLDFKQRSAHLANANAGGYDVLRYDLFMDWTNPLSQRSETGTDRRFSGIQTILLRLDSTRIVQSKMSLEFDAPEDQIRIDSAFVNSIGTRITRENTSQPSQTVLLALTNSHLTSDTLTVRLFYTHISSANSADGTGFLLYRKGRLGAVRTGNDSVFLPQRLAYTMSQPYGARRWMPCNDVPSDKAFTTIAVRVPQGFIGVANGLLKERRKDSSGGETFFWDHSSLTSPYLMAVTSSIYTTYREYYHKVSNPNDSIPIDHYFWQEDDNDLPLNNRNYNARRSFQITPGTIAAFARYFGEYPYESYAHTVVQPFVAGGMEHQTVSTINRAWLRGSSAAGIAHEIIHQWFGDKVTCASWEDIWLNEGTATYGEALWYESWGGLSWNMVAMEGFRRGYFASRTRLNSVYVSNPASIDAIFNTATTYFKGAWIHHILRRIYGDSVYFPAMRLFLNRHAFSTATTADFTRAFREIIGKKLVPVPVDTLIRQWVYERGEPSFSAAWRHISSETNAPQSYSIQVTLSQMQTSEMILPVFTIPVELSFWKYSPDKRDTMRFQHTIVMKNRREIRQITLPFLPDSLVIDEADNLLCLKASAPQLTEQGNISILRYPSPLQQGTPVSVDIALRTADFVSATVFNALGQQVSVLHSGFASAGIHSFRSNDNFPCGTYFVRVQSGTENLVQKILIAP